MWTSGADILSTIEFPYPVVPIVRAHHENWDGTGYPRGLRGDDIPIGARILSVVDCYDALTSDRPYRPAMTQTQATDILLERRGSMYDPTVVDAFLAAAAVTRRGRRHGAEPGPRHAPARGRPRGRAGVPSRPRRRCGQSPCSVPRSKAWDGWCLVPPVSATSPA